MGRKGRYVPISDIARLLKNATGRQLSRLVFELLLRAVHLKQQLQGHFLWQANLANSATPTPIGLSSDQSVLKNSIYVADAEMGRSHRTALRFAALASIFLHVRSHGAAMLQARYSFFAVTPVNATPWPPSSPVCWLLVTAIGWRAPTEWSRWNVN
jgi:hypothetical protein